MQTKSKVINKLALVLISIVVLELVLIGDQVQPVKAIKKKILLKKLKKVLPLLALIKPKKKIILLPIPIPMLNKQPGQHQYQTYGGGSGGGVPSVGRPMMMMNAEGSNQMPFISGQDSPTPSQMMGPMVSQMMPNYDTMLMSMTQPPPQSFSMMMPSMTMTIENSGPASGGGMSNIELSTMIANSSQSGALIQQQQLQQFDQFDEPSPFDQQQPGGEHYYSSPWSNDNQRRPLASPAKLLRGHDRFRPNQQQQQLRQPQQQQQTFRPMQSMHEQHQHNQQHQQTVTLVTPVVIPKSSRFQQQAGAASSQRPMVPVLVIKNQWKPTSGRLATSGKSNTDGTAKQTPTEQPRQPKYQQQAEYEELIPVGPPRLMPIYQTPNGQLHMSPPTADRQQPTRRPHEGDSFDHEREQQQQQQQSPPPSSTFGQGGNFQQPGNLTSSNFDAAEVQTIPSSENLFGIHQPELNANHPSSEPTDGLASNRPAPPNSQQLIKGKQQQQQQPQTTKRKPIGGGGGY